MDNCLSNYMVNTYYIDTNQVEINTKVYNILTTAEYKRYKSYKIKNAGREFLFGRYLLKSVIGSYLNIDPKVIVLKKNKYGKLFLDKEEYQSDIKFNLSHSHGIVVGAFVLNNPIGIDIEKITNDILDIAKRFFSKEEIEYINQNNNSISLLYKVWTLKEAFIKAKGLGFSVPLASFSVFNDLGVFFHTRRVFKDFYLSIAVDNADNNKFNINFKKFTA